MRRVVAIAIAALACGTFVLPARGRAARASAPRARAPAAAASSRSETASARSDAAASARSEETRPAADPATQESRDALLARWREALELDLAAEVVRDARARFASDPALARDGRAIALDARALVATGAEEEAASLLARAEVEEGTRPALEIARARLALERDELAGALSRLLVEGSKPAAERVRFPEEPDAWLLAGRALARQGDPAAEALLARFLELAPHATDAPAAWHMIAQSAVQRRDSARATEAARRAAESSQWQAFYRTRRIQVREHPDEPLPRLGLAELWLAAGEPARARAVLQELLARSPEFCRALASLGEAELALGDRTAARAAFDRALACDATLSEARWGRARLALSDGRDADARPDLEAILGSPSEKEPKYLRAHLELARLLKRAGDATGAEQRERRYRELGGREPL